MNNYLPWQQAEDDFSIFVEDARGRIIADVRSNSMTMEQHKERARLIAAAPEMLAALKAAESRLEYLNKKHPESIQTFNTLKEIKAAIAKAEGA